MPTEYYVTIGEFQVDPADLASPLRRHRLQRRRRPPFSKTDPQRQLPLYTQSTVRDRNKSQHNYISNAPHPIQSPFSYRRDRVSLGLICRAVSRLSWCDHTLRVAVIVYKHTHTQEKNNPATHHGTNSVDVIAVWLVCLSFSVNLCVDRTRSV